MTYQRYCGVTVSERWKFCQENSDLGPVKAFFRIHFDKTDNLFYGFIKCGPGVLKIV